MPGLGYRAGGCLSWTVEGSRRPRLNSDLYRVRILLTGGDGIDGALKTPDQ